MSTAGLVARLALWTALLAGGLGLLAWCDWDLDRLFALLPSAAPGWFLAAMALLPLAGFPIAVFYLYAGATYGFGLGWALCLAALAVNLLLSHLVGAHLLRAPIRSFLARRGHALPDLSSLNQFRFTFLLRTVPGPPFPVQNYLLAAGGVRLGIYWPVSWLTQGVLAAGMVALGHTTALPRARVYVLVGLAFVALLILLKAGWKRRLAGPSATPPA